MVLDPISALSLAANVVQFVDFSSKVVSKGCRIYISADGALPNNLELEVVTNDLSRLAKGLKDSELNTVTVSEEEKSLQTMSDECSKIAEELLRRLENLKVKGNSKQRGWKSLRQALKSEWSKEELDGLSERLSIFRDQLQFHILVSMKTSMNLQTLQYSSRFDSLDQATKSLLSSLLENKTIFTSQINIQTITITDLHLETRALIQNEASKTRTEILDALRVPKFVSTQQKSCQNAIPSNRVANSWNEHSQIQEIILHSLRFSAMDDRYEAIKEAHTKTFEWIFQNSNNVNQPWDNFSTWLEDGDGIYWISGKAGSGKSTLMRYIRDSPHLRTLLQKWCAQDKDLIVASFFFWISGVPDQSSQVGLLRSLLFVLLSSKRNLIETTLPDLWLNLRLSTSLVQYSQTYNWTLARVTSCFRRLFSMLSQATGHVFLLIDGLDEYQGNPTDTIELLQSIVSPNVKICVSSRPWQVFEVAFKKAPKLRLQDLTIADIKRFVSDKLLGNQEMRQICAIDPVGAPKLVEEIVGKAQGVFLWVTLVVKSFINGLRNGDSISYLRKRLEQMPSEIEDLYSYMLSKIESIYYEEGRRVFSIVRLAFYQEQKYIGDGISAIHLSFAMGNNHDNGPCESWSNEKVATIVDWVDSRLKVCCAGLLELSSLQEYQHTFLEGLGNRTIQYIHRTAKDFLELDDAGKRPRWIHPVVTDQINLRMMRANVMYLKSCVQGNEFIERMEDFLIPFIRRMMWLAYEAEQETSCHNAEILDAFEVSASQLFGSSIKWGDIVSRELIGSNKEDWCDDFLSLVIVWRLNLYLGKKLGTRNEVLNAKKGRPYLDYALRYNGEERWEDNWDLRTISTLLEHGGDPNLPFSTIKQESGQYHEYLPYTLTNSTPWQAVLYAIDLHLCSGNEKVISSLLVPLFGLMLSHGADPDATTCPNVRGKKLKLFGCSVTVIASQSWGRARLLPLLQAAKRQQRRQKGKSLPVIYPISHVKKRT